jgi:hypothetical protein
MESMELLVLIIAFIFGILNLILFFKIWGMTDDVRVIKRYLLSRGENETNYQPESTSQDVQDCQEAEQDGKFRVGDLVVNIKTGKQMRVKRIFDGRYACCSQGGNFDDGYFSETEIELFQNRRGNKRH